jgi:hypothetical protein
MDMQFKLLFILNLKEISQILSLDFMVLLRRGPIAI